ncbi:mitochondrial carrier domain-containing protein [Gorgonomyces haynaldii]|nr:mitochondrial carrier domain-containing protein [Gorgonomyces haynaldii]
MNENLKGFLSGSLAACGAVTLTNPLEVVKTRLQLQGELRSSTHVYDSAIGSLFKIARQEGLMSLQKGLFVAYGYQILLNGTRLGLYEPLRNEIQGQVDRFTGQQRSAPALAMVSSGALSGILGSAIASPLFLVKTRMQSYAGKTVSVGHQHADVTKGAWFVLKSIYRREGVRGLWRGADASMLRTGVGSAVQLSSYDFFKTQLLKTGFFHMNEGHGNIHVHFSASLITSFFVCLFMNPFDVASTRMYNQMTATDGKHGSLYKNGFDCLVKTVKAEGPSALYKGFTAHYLRIGPHTILTFVFLEQFKALFRLIP